MIRRVFARVPAAGWICALVAFLSAAAWGLVTPVFHVPDEPQHIAYAQYLAETARPPSDPSRSPFSTEEATAFGLIRFDHVAGNKRGRPPWTGEEVESLNGLDSNLRADDGGGLTNAASNPPTYYALQVIPYWLASSGSFLDQVLLMRLLSALLAGVTALFCFAFVREVMPGAPWAWAVGALAVAFQPVFGFIGGGVIPDNLLFATSAATLWLLARAFRRGVTPRWGIAFGLVLAAGLLTKGTALGLVPAACIGMVLLVLRADPMRRARAMRSAALAAGVAALVTITYLVVSELAWDRPLYPGTGTLASGPEGEGRSLAGLVEYAWQFYLPRLPFMEDQWLGTFPLYDVWFLGFVGRFGWLDYGFPSWANTVALAIAGIILVFAASMVMRSRSAIRSRWAELITYLAAVAGFAAMIAIAGYGYRVDTGDVFEQTRYLFPLLPLYAALVALAVRGAGRYGRVVGAGMVVIAAGHELFALLLTVSRFYG